MYSDYLGLDTEKLLRAWDGIGEATADGMAAIEHTQPQTPSPISSGTVGQAPEPEAEIELDPTQTIFHQIGLELRTRREALSLTYQDAENYTLVREYYLRRMEAGEFDELPSSVQARGMLNNYASFLNLDVEDTMLRYADALQLRSEEKAKRTSDPRERKKRAAQKPVRKAGKLKQFLTPDLFVGLLVLLGMGAIILYSAVTIADIRSRTVESTPDVREAFLEQLGDNDQTETPTIEPTGTAAAVPVAGNLVPTADDSVQLTGAIQVYIEANQRAFLQVKSDGKDVFTGRTVPGNTYPFDAAELIEIITGNAAALTVTYNQQRLGILGNLGESLYLQFDGGVPITPTPLISPTPTNTFQPTYTEMPETPTPTLTITPYIP